MFFTCGAAPAICATCTALTVDENRNLLYTSLTEMGYEAAKPDGAFYLFVKAPNGDAMQFSNDAKLK